VDYTHVAGAALLIYDYLQTIHLEIRLVWCSPWGYTKVLFFLTRYVPIANIYALFHNQLFLDVSKESCRTMASVLSWLLFTGIVSAEAILMIRTWAVWHRDWRFAIFFVALLIGSTVGSSVNINEYLKALRFGPPPYPGFRGCIVIKFSQSLLAQFIILTCVDGVVLMLMAISAFRAYKVGDTGELTKIIHRDAIAFYVWLLFCSTASAVINSAAPPDLMNMLCPLQGAFHSVLASRIIFNIRNVVRRQGSSTNIELHSHHGEMSVWDPETELIK